MASFDSPPHIFLFCEILPTMVPGFVRRLLIGLILPLTAMASVTAASPSPNPGTQQQGLSIYPKSELDTSLPGGHFTYNLTPGGRVQDGLVVQNYTPNTMTVDVYAADLIQAGGGEVAPTQKGAVLKGVGSWVTVSEPEVTLPPNTQTVVAFTVAVPPGVAPQNNEGAIVAAATVGTAGNFGVQARVALIVEVDIPGTANPSGRLSTLNEAKGSTPDAKKFAMDLTNTGNVLLVQHGNVVVRDSDGKVVTKLPLGPQDSYAVPTGTLRLTTPTWTPPRSGKYTVQAEMPIAYNTAKGEVVAAILVSNTLPYTFIDWQMVGLEFAGGLVVLALVVRAFLIWRRRRRDAQRIRNERAQEARTATEVAQRLRGI